MAPSIAPTVGGPYRKVLSFEEAVGVNSSNTTEEESFRVKAPVRGVTHARFTSSS